MLSAVIVDDHPVSRTFMEHLLRAEGLVTLQASDADAALRIAGERAVDIWLVDWVMPGMNGVDLVRTIRRRKGGELAYVFMLTSKGSDEDLSLAFEAGVDDFFRKPIGAMELKARFRAAVRVATVTRQLASKIAEISRLNADLEEMASTDAMTGLLNRRAGMARLSEAWGMSLRSGRPLSVALIDIDQFKRINDAFGHARGDAVIRHVGATIRDTLRTTDFVARVGGEEFLAVFPDTESAAAAQIIERCRVAVGRGRCASEGKEIVISISAGIASRSGSTASHEQLVQLADGSLYTAKRAGRDQVMITDDALAA